MLNQTVELGELLIREGRLTTDQLNEALADQAESRRRLGEILCHQGVLDPSSLVDALCIQLGHRRFDPASDVVEPSALDAVPVEVARRYDLLPVRASDGRFTIAMADPLDLEALDHLHRLLAGRDETLDIIMATPERLQRARERHYGSIASSRNVTDLIERVVDEIGETVEDDTDDDAELRAEHAGIVNLVDQIIVQALQERATDIHIEPQEKSLVIRYRVDGLLEHALSPPRAVYTGTISRIKILADMDIAERRAAQDGRFTHRMPGREVDIRVSAIPTIHGEKLVLRLLDKSAFRFTLPDLGFSKVDHEAFGTAIHQPFGMVLLSGPTGSGKTTTLYASLLELMNDTLNITTVEDPVEYQIAGINQVQVNARKEVTFSTALRSFLRQDPDAIMVGEIRDRDTADIAIRAALTGHMVFSTIHANDAPSTATRLVSMGAESFMAASALTLVAAQRLVRRVCRHCAEPYTPREEVLLALGVEPSKAHAFRRGTGCAECNGRGFAGRVAVIERMSLTGPLRQLIGENRPTDDIRKLALEEGMVTLRRNGIQKATEGMTTLEEVLRVCHE